MRVSLWPGLLQALGSNQRRQQQRVRLFEVGRRYAGTDGAETEVIAGVVAGSALPEQWGVEATKVDFFDVKADVEALLDLTGAAAQFRFVPERHPALAPGSVGAHLARRSGRRVAGRAASGAFAPPGFDISGIRVRGRDAGRL